MTELKTPKGCYDVDPLSCTLKTSIINQITNIFTKHGACTIDTPTFELSSILKNKYGDDSKLIFDLQSLPNCENYSLRYDLTVSLARYLAMNKICKLRRYQIGKVFRKDLPNKSKARFCEFYQCDFDICGSYERLLPDAEILKVAVDILNVLLPSERFTMRVNHRKLHEAFLSLAGIDIVKHNSVCSSIDKLGKISETELVEELKNKELNISQIEYVLEYVKMKGSGIEFLEQLKNMEVYTIPCGKLAVDDLILLYQYAQVFKISSLFIFDLSLSRGTDYYTGMIFECEYDKYKVGTVIAGGRYDDLVGNFVRCQADTKAKRTDEFNVPCVGLSVGLERIFSILKDRVNVRASKTMVYIGSFAESLLMERLELLNVLWDNGIPTETHYGKLNMKKQASFCEKNGIPIILSIGETEIKENIVRVSYGEKLKNKLILKREDMIKELLELIKQVHHEN